MRKNFPRVWEIVHCTLCAYCVHIIVQFTLYTLVYSSHCTLHTAHCTMPLVGRQLEVCTLHCTLYIVLMPCTLYSSHCTCRFTCWYTVPVHLCTSAPVHCTCACTCRHMYLTLVPAAHCAAGVWTICVFTSWLFYMESLHRVTIVLAGVLQAGLQVSSSLAFLLAGGQLSHTLCTTVPCILYTVHGVTSSSRYVQEFSLL